jgi:Ca-activated chloride channel family protein
MKTHSHCLRIKLSFLAIVQIFTCTQIMFGQDEEDRTISPYFVVSAPDSTTDRLPLRQTSAEVTISGVIADVTVRQTYCNEGENVLEAIYVFPASTRAAVYAMNMKVGERILHAVIMEKGEAREKYEEAKEEGKTTSLLEQDRPNVFRMNVANILPGDTIHIEMKYTELLVPLEGVYEFVYPTVVGPRYVSPSEDSASTAFAGTPFTPEGEPPLYDFTINVSINSGVTLKELTCPSHDSTLIDISGNVASCNLLSKKEGNRDFILHYRLSGDHMESGLLLYEGEDENFFLAMIQPPAYPTDSEIPPREYVFIMDVSGSMRGFPIDISKTLLEDLISRIRESDRFNVVFFAGGSRVLSSASLPATYENRQLAIEMIDSQEGGGGTELMNALNTALNLPGTTDFSRSFIIATDGYVSVERQAFDFIRNNLGEANFFPFGIGGSVNRFIIEGMAHVGVTEPIIVTDSEKAPEAAEKFRQYIQYPVLTNIETSYDGFEVYDVEPVSVPDVLAQRPVIIYGKWRGQPAGTLTLTGNSGNEVYRESLEVSQYTPSGENSALRYLWARKRIQLLDDYCAVTDGFGSPDSSMIREVTELGLKYNLLTQYTSFIAVDSTIRNEGDSITTVIQPLPLPEGVPDEAVGDFGGFVSAYNLGATEKADIQIPVAELYPNPFRESLTLILNLSKEDLSDEIQVTITGMSGKPLYTLQLPDLKEGGNRIVLNPEGVIPGITSGVYIVSVKSGKRVLSRMRVLYLGE